MSEKFDEIKELNAKIMATCPACGASGDRMMNAHLEMVDGVYVHADGKPCPASAIHAKLDEVAGQKP